MNKLFKMYRSIHEQGFLPIFVDDELDRKMLVEVCINAGCKGIEYTLRCRDAHTMIPWIRKNYPDLFLLVGSTLDSDLIINRARKRKHEQLLTLDELADMGVDGFISMHGFSEKTIRKFSRTHLLVPAATTLTEALRQFDAGAHFIKILGPNMDLVHLCRSPATYEYCPIFLTGGMTTERIPKAVQAGAVLTGAGFEVILKDFSIRDKTSKEIIKVLTKFLKTMQKAIDTYHPNLGQVRGSDDRQWLKGLPHQHPFDEI
jgi:2-keto-3-deoxy-6-phosphogluconate aldolase